MSQNAPLFRCALISMPWALFNRPSIQLGALKAFLELDERYHVDCFHPYLLIAKAIGPEQYRKISLNSWAGESLFSPLLFPEKQDDASSLFHQSIEDDKRSRPQFKNLSRNIDLTLQEWLATIDLSQYKLIGFSVCFSQLLPSLYLARLIKQQYPQIPIVFGGSSCSGGIGPSLLLTFPEIDFVVDGEGEESLRKLCLFLEKKLSTLPPKIYSKEKTATGEDLAPIASLDQLPVPDYAQYFKEIRHLFPAQPFIPVLPVEFSRGCWWNKCTFCNLNLQWKGYRAKNSDRLFNEVIQLSQLHECLSFTFTDNALPPKETERFFQMILEKEINLDFFAEIRAISDPAKLQRFYNNGLRTVQVGIEALSSSLLTKMAKGTKAIDNMAVMKMCSQYGIQLEGNLIMEFPSSNEEEVEETLVNLDFVLPFSPLQTATFFLGYGSPVHSKYKEYGIQAILPHSKNSKLYPKKQLQSMTMIVNGYRGDRTKQKTQWQQVRKKVAAWQDFHIRRVATRTHPLHFRDGGTFLIIRQETIHTTPLQHRLRGLSRRIYLYCEIPRTMHSILEHFPGLGEKALRTFVADMSTKRLMFQESDHVLALAVHHS